MARVPDEHLSQATIRCYAELNDFLAPHRRQRDFTIRFFGRPAVKDLIESLDIPHGEVDCVLLNGESVSLTRQVSDGDRLSVYPVFERFDIGSVSRVERAPLREPRFVADVHLGRLARDLRLLGFDTLWENDLDDPTIRRLSLEQHRVILTRDLQLLKHGEVQHGYFVRSTDPDEQLGEVLAAMQLEDRVRPWTRCSACNGVLETATPASVRDAVPAGVWRRQRDFRRCAGCGRIYWQGSHYDRIRARLTELGLVID